MLFLKLDGDPKTQKGGSSDRADRDGHIRDGWGGLLFAADKPPVVVCLCLSQQYARTHTHAEKLTQH